MNDAAKAVLRKNRTSSHEMMMELHWLPVKARIEYKLCLLLHSYFDGSMPTYLTNLLRLYAPSRSLRSSADTRRFVVPVSRLRVGERAFSVCGPKTWNALPQSIREIEEKACFKRQLKTYYFDTFLNA